MLPDTIASEEALRAALQGPSFLLFKHSPICPISDAARRRLESFVADQSELAWGWLDVIAQRAWARGIVAEHDIRHESPQALWFAHGKCIWHASHDAITETSLAEARDLARSATS